MSNRTNQNSMLNEDVSRRLRNEAAEQLGILDKVTNHPEQLTAREAGALGGNVTKAIFRAGLTGEPPVIKVSEDEKQMVSEIESKVNF